ncbi:PREDICTED: uncharacterized protein PF11_0213-like [Papilio polytes]|uniref:uncharacterized protein PF11_0213-like n=1 Tax=Papilio polytes TaxID=76194 RepID=UPI000675C233|nr:PREDICTED: uncharacterized protein PF11_0213-like [Papilio polytes]
MHRSRIPSPARSEGSKVTPRRHRFRASRSVCSPARSDVSVKLSSIVQMRAMQSPAVSPLRTRRSILSDNTDIEVPGRQSWWKRLEDNSRDVMEVLETKTTDQPENIEEFIEADFKSQENDYTVDLPESSDGESINSIILPQRKFFSQKQTQSNKLFNKIIENRENLTHRKSKANTDNTIFVGKKSFFSKDTVERRSRPTFPPGLLNMTDKTLVNKTQDITKHEQVRNLLGNRAGTKRKNMFADFIMSESEEEIPDIQPNVLGFTKSKQPQRKMSSQGIRNSPRSNETDLEFDEWQQLPSSTMVDNEFGDIESSPVKRPRLSKPDSVIEEVRGNVRNKIDKTKLTLIMSHNLDDNDFNESDKRVPKKTHEKTLTQIPDTDARPFTEVIQVDSDDENNFTLRYDNDKNMQNDEIDVTVKELEKNNTNTSKNSNTTVTNEKVLKTRSSLKEKSVNKSITVELRDAIDGTKTINIDQDKNVSWKILKTHKEQHAVINTKEDLVEKDASNINTSAPTTHKDDRKINIEKENISINKEKTTCETEVNKHTTINTPQGEAILEIDQNDEVLQDKEMSKNIDNSLNEVKIQQDKNKIVENVDNQITDDINNIDPNKEKTLTHISQEENNDMQNVEDAKLKETVQETRNSTINTSNREENRERTKNREKVDNISIKEINDKTKEICKEAQEIAIPSVNEDIDQADEHNKEKETVNVEENNPAYNETINKSLASEKQATFNENLSNEAIHQEENITEDNEMSNKSLSEKQASLNENILTDDEQNVTEDNDMINESKEKTNQMTSVDESNMTEDKDNDNQEDGAEESEQNETDQAGVSSMDVNNETDDENPKESDEDSDGDDADENEITEENAEIGDELEISSINKSNEEQNESDEGISDRIGMPSMNIDSDEDNENNEDMSAEQEINDSNAKTDNQVTFSKGRIYLTNVTGESTHSYAEAADSEPEETQSRLALEEYLMKIKNDNIEKRRKVEEEVRNSLKTTSREPFNNFKAPARVKPIKTQQRNNVQQKTKSKKMPSLLNIENLPPELLDDMKYKPPRRYQPKNAAWITKRLYKYLETKLEPKYDYKARVKAESVVELLYEFSKEVRRQHVAAPPAVRALRQRLARLGLLATHYDFYTFMHDFMPREIRVKVVPDVVNEIPLPRNGVFSNIL